VGYWYNLGVAFDQLANAAAKGKPDETLSGRWGRTRDRDKIADLASRALDHIDPDHAFDAIELHPRTGEAESHHMGDYEERRKAEEAALKLALSPESISGELQLDDATMNLASMGALRQQLRELARDRAARKR
jgi:hypothetical protein